MFRAINETTRVSFFINKWIVLPKNEHFQKMYSSSDIQDVDEFISSSDFEKCSIASLGSLTNWSSAENGCRQSPKTDKNITIHK